MNFPKRNKNAKNGITGETFFSNYVTNELKCIYHSISQENDFGIDGYIELIKDEYVTGKMVAVQIKHGDSYFRSKTNNGYKYYGENKHINYYINNMTDVYLVIISDDFKSIHWVKFEISKMMKSGKCGWCMEIPQRNILNERFKQNIFEVVGPIIDMEEIIKNNWEIDKLLRNSKHTFIQLLREDIESLSFINIKELFDQYIKNNQVLIDKRNTIDIIFRGYDDDPREIFEIPEIRNWINTSVDIGIPWFYFLDFNCKNNGLNLLIQSYCGVKNAVKLQDGSYDFTYKGKNIAEFYKKNFRNLNIFTEVNDISVEINNEITEGIFRYYNMDY